MCLFSFRKLVSKIIYYLKLIFFLSLIFLDIYIFGLMHFLSFIVLDFLFMAVIISIKVSYNPLFVEFDDSQKFYIFFINNTLLSTLNNFFLNLCIIEHFI